MPLNLRSHYMADFVKLSDEELNVECKKLIDSMHLIDDDVIYIERATRGQSESITWHEQRVGRITASIAHSVVHTSIYSPSSSLIRKICLTPSLRPLNVDSLQWGREHESDALKEYSDLMGRTHANVNVQKAGLWLCKQYPFLGASVDGVRTCECHCDRIIEVKCPFSYKDTSDINDMISHPNFCLNKEMLLKLDHPYYTQVQLQMYVRDLRDCDFVVWTPKFLIVVETERDDTFISDMLIKLCTFYEKCVAPEILTCRLENESQQVNVLPGSDVLLCKCKQVWDGKQPVITCHEPLCTIKWYHMSCLNLKRRRSGAWYCPLCRKSRK